MEKGWCRVGSALLALIFAGTAAAAYETDVVKDGGVIQGKIILKGVVPSPQVFELRRSPDKDFCGAVSDGHGNRLLPKVVTGRDGGLKDVVVVVEGVEKGKPFTFSVAHMEANMCQFLPFVSVVTDRRQIVVTNRDPISHDIQGYAYDPSGVDIVLHRPSLTNSGTTDTVNLTKGRKVFVMQCGLHPYMQSWGYGIDNPYYAVTDLDGAFTISDLPAGTYVLKVWHPRFGLQERRVTVDTNSMAVLGLTFDSSKEYGR
jgi:hypothetical protein